MLSVATLVLAMAWLWLRLPRSRPGQEHQAGGQQRRRHEARSQALAAPSPDGGISEMLQSAQSLCVIATNVDGIVTLFTKGAETMLGYAAAEVIGKMSVLAFHDPHELRTRAQTMGVQANFDVFRALPNLGLCDEREWLHVNKEGRRIPVALTVSSVTDANGKITGYLGISRDLTAAKAIARDRDGFFSVCQELLLKVDAAGKILGASPSFLRVLGYHPHELEGRYILDFVHPDDAAATRACVEDLLRRREAYRFENRWRDKAGNDHHISWDGTAPGEHGISFGGGLDITQKKRREAEREESLAVEKRLMGIVSHDLRNPLTTIGMAAQLIERSPQKEELVLRNVGRILQSCRRAETLIHDVLDFSQARHFGGITVRRSPIDLVGVVRKAVDELAVAHPNRTIEIDAPEALLVEADGGKMNQLLGNLLTNGLKYSPADRPVVVRLSSDAEANTLEVANDGPPIAPQLLPHLFEPFRRGRDGDGRQHSVGLGLYIVAQVAKAHGGSVAVHSDAAAGTSFRVSLPHAS